MSVTSSSAATAAVTTTATPPAQTALTARAPAQPRKPHHEQRAVRQIQHVITPKTRVGPAAARNSMEPVARTVEQLLKNKNSVHGKAAVREAETRP